MLTIERINAAKAQIWASESHRLTIISSVSTRTDTVQFIARCDDTLDERRLTETNYVQTLNDMFYDYCVENAAWMGVS